ncbi:M91 family zinc metallopeptidase [Pseudomonas sp. NPDC089752]|uniref:M91 family zinc metallopeptidase n=1 Tax=Pseudomonas sp. NPDC089752 TaxID=3364472 RepID=UPI0037F7BC06
MNNRTLTVSHGQSPATSSALPYTDQRVSIKDAPFTVMIEIMTEGANLLVQASPPTLGIQLDDAHYDILFSSNDIAYIRTGHGNDVVQVDADGSTRVVVETREGNDHVKVNCTPSIEDDLWTRVVVDTGPGDDRIEAHGIQEAELDGGPGNDEISSSAAYGMLYAGPGKDKLTVEDGRAIIEAMSGTNTIYNGPLDDRIYGHAQSIVAAGGDTAPLLLEAGKQTLPERYAATFAIHGDANYTNKILVLLNMLKSSQTASALLADLVSRHAKVTIRDTPVLYNAYTRSDRSHGDPRVHDGQRGHPVLECVIEFNPLINVRRSPAVVALYHELCHAWNLATGSMLGNREQQAVGLDSGEAFDFDDDPSTPPSSTNPDPFNENALRRELGLPLRLKY